MKVMSEMWSGNSSRRIVERIVVECYLILQTPAHFGNGDGDDLIDIPLLYDPHDEAEGKITPLLTGASIAGALRSYLREREFGYGGLETDASYTVALFGKTREKEEGLQSPLIVDDARPKAGRFELELRDGVQLNADSRTAADKKKFDIELWQAGTRFPLRFELLISEDAGKSEQQNNEQAARLKCALVSALDGFSDGSITLGARKHRGYGRVTIKNLRSQAFNMRKKEDLLKWIESGQKPLPPAMKKFLEVNDRVPDHRDWFNLSATFELDGSLLIRTEPGLEEYEPNKVHLRSQQPDGKFKPVLSGTSLGGALRARALKIACFIGDETRACKMIERMFGPEMKPEVKPRASRVTVEEQEITLSDDIQDRLIQSRVSIDRFTGGALDTALFNQRPVFGGTTTIKLKLTAPTKSEIGLLMFLLKDLWTSNLPLGGEISIGRGRLKGQKACIRHIFMEGETRVEKVWHLPEAMADVEQRAEIEEYATSLHTALNGESMEGELTP
jgi:CRISPR/Cas system CSM-associated protein Csm3 (group 7 of RAMP superfamily)